MTESGKGNNLTSLEYGIAGASTGIITRFTCQPLDVLKIRFQLQVDPIKKSSATSKYKSLLQAAQLISKEEGFFALWKGHIPAQWLSIAFGAVQFASYERLTSAVYKYHPYQNSLTEPLLHFMCGSSAGVLAVCVSYPLDIIRTRLVAQGEPKVYQGMADAAVQIWKYEGVRGYSKGIVPACIQMAPLAGLTFGFHNIFKTFWLSIVQEVDPHQMQSISTVGNLFAGSMAGLCGKVIVYPLDLVKKRLQIQGFDQNRTCFRNVLQCTGVVQCIFLTVKIEGVLGLFKGLPPSLIKAAFSNAIYFTVYDKVCQILCHTKR